MTGRGVRARPEEKACCASGPEASPARLRLSLGPPRPQADAGRDSREHRDGRPHHAVGEATPFHIHGDAAGALILLHVRLGRRRRLHFRHPGRGWRRRQQEQRTPFRFRHAARGALRAPRSDWPRLWCRSSPWRHFPEMGSAPLGLPPGIRAAFLWARPAPPHSLCACQPRVFAAYAPRLQKGCSQAVRSLAPETYKEL